ncbi:MAG: hypothetical protein IJ200_00680 [Prevotella sp.]|nr:hypothetical protein [Prevotella sp.]
MKKLITLLLVLTGMVCTASASKTISLNPGNWTNDGWCALWVWNSSSEGHWENLSDYTATNGVYSISVTDDMTTWFLIRGAGSEPGWTTEWNRSGNLSIEGDDFLYTFDEIKNDVTIGNGITKTEIFHFCSILGDFTGGWDIADAVDMTQSTEDASVYTLVVEKEVTAGTKYYRLEANHKTGVCSIDTKNYTFNESGKFELTFTANVSTRDLTLSAKRILEIGTSKLITFSSADAYNFTGTGATAYVVSSLSASAATLTVLNDVPKETGVIVSAASAGKYYIPFGGATVLPDGVTNKLHEAHAGCNVTDSWKCYVLYTDGYFHPANDGAIPAGRAYLLASDVEGAGFNPNAQGARLSLVFAEDATAVESVKTINKQDNAFYNLAGQRIAQPTKGLYIVNGKKVIIK